MTNFRMFNTITEKIKKWVRSRRFWKRLFFYSVVIPTLLLVILVSIVYVKQDEIVQGLMHDLNEDFRGKAQITDSHISLFENFPYLSIDLEEFKVYESKNEESEPMVNVHDVYIGFNVWTILSGKMDIKKIKLKGGHLNLVQHKNGEFNIVKALSPEKEIESPEEEFHLDLRKIELEDVHLTKLNEENSLKVDAFVYHAQSKFKTSSKHIKAGVDASFMLNIIKNGDTTFIKHKHIDLDTEVDFIKKVEKMTIQPTTVHLEGSEFNMEGTIDFLKDVYLDLNFTGNKPNFDLFIAMAPEEFMHSMSTFENKGEIYINTKIIGPSINGHNPAITAKFGCKNGFFKNTANNRKVDNINFIGHFTNGKEKSMETMEFSLKKISAKPEQGKLKGDISVRNFKAPDMQVVLSSEVDLSFLSQFIDFEGIHQLRGKSLIDINFHDVIDPENPSHALSTLNEKFNISLKFEDISFSSDYYHLPVKDFDLLTTVDGHLATIIECNLKLGQSDLNIIGTIDDLPAILHHTDIPVDTRLKIKSKKLDLYQLTGSDSTSINEQITNLSMDFDFKASARAFTESKYLPQGEFFIENLYAKLKNYPHTLHDFHADIFVEEEDLRVVDFKGMIDKSDFLFTGKLEHYEKWLDPHPGGDSKIEFNLKSKMLQLESLFTYKGDNYVPEEYRHEEFDDLSLHGETYLHYNDGLKSMDLTLDHFNAKMKVHPLRFQNFMGRIHYEDEHLVVEDFHGKLGLSEFKTTLHYYLGDNPTTRLRDNHFSITASRLDIDQLIKYNPAPAIKGNKAAIKGETIDHDKGFNIYELPFTDMTYHFDIKHLNYHRYLMHNIVGELRTTPKHYMYIDKLKLDAAGGHFDIKGYFNGSNPKLIYFSPDIDAYNVNLDQLLLKFDNFGQDHLVSENLHGKFTGKITGKIHMHNDMTPKIDDSEIHMDVDVTHGRLENYALLNYMSDYFKDKNLDKVLFDTLNNHLDMVNGVLTIPKMTINSTLGHMEISGKQDLNGKMEYYLRIPWRMVTSTAASKLFEKNKEAKDEDEIVYGNDKTKYVNIKIIGDEKGYKFSLGKDKKGK